MAKIKGSWLLNEDFTFPETDIRQNVNFTTNQTLTNSDGVSSNTFRRMQILGGGNSSTLRFDYWDTDKPVAHFDVRWSSSWQFPEYDRIVHFGDTEQEVDDVFWLCFTANAKNLSSGEDEPDTPEPDDPDTPEVETPSPDSVRAKILNLIAKANVTTGKSDTDLTSGVNSLIEGYGAGGTAEGTAIPVGEAVGRIYFNTNLSVEETNAYLRQLTYVQTPLYEYPISVIYAEQKGDQIYALFATGKNSYQIMVTPDIHYGAMLLFDSGENDWVRHNGFRVEPNDPVTYVYAVETNFANSEDYTALTDFNGIPVGAENEKIKNVLSITPFGATVGGGTSADSPLPINVATESEMTALLATAEVGSVYKYTGESGTYENGALYIVEAVSG